MTGRLLHTAPPPPRAWHDPLLAPVALAGNAALFAAQLAVARTARVHWDPAPPEPAPGRPVFYFTWHRFNYACVPAFLALPSHQRPALVMHDGFASRALTHRSSTWLGFDAVVFRRRGAGSPREQLIRFVRETGSHLLNLPDSGGPYGRVKPGMVEIAVACDAVLQPFVVRTRGAVAVGKRLRHVFPLPFCDVLGVCGPTLEGANATVERCQQALDALASVTD